jgi:hypothetical protein
MYCAACGAPLTPGISYCNRCGSSVKERTESKPSSPLPFLAAITLIGVIGMGIMLGGSMALKKEADMPVDFIGFFVLFTFIITMVTEILLVRQMSRLTGRHEPKLSRRERAALKAAQHFVPPAQMAFGPGRSLAEPGSSVTENTTRTLEYSPTEPGTYKSK